MPRAKPVLAGFLAVFLAAGLVAGSVALAAGPDDGEARLLFAGDLLLSRQVEVEIDRTGRDPWERLEELFRKADLVSGNLEGAVGHPDDCLPGASPCFAIVAARIPLLARAGFRALSVENNHAGDLGEGGRAATRKALRDAGLRPVSFEGGPSFFRLHGHTVALVALNLVPGPGSAALAIPSAEVRRQLRLARIAEAVVVSVHWGEELVDWPSDRDREVARWLVRNGATVVVGHHPHVVRQAECVEGHPVFYSLGNHLFDQKYPGTKEGLIADCRVAGGTLSCSGIGTRSSRGSFRPEPVPGVPEAVAPLGACTPPLNWPLHIGKTVLRPAFSTDGAGLVLEGVREGRVEFRTRPIRALSAEAVPRGEDGGPFLFVLERHPSPIDGEEGVRPYVYEVGPNGLIAKWRGSALAWPLVDATFLPGDPPLLCALHRRDAFLTLDASSPADRPALYRWNGFGFSGAEEAGALEACRAVWGGASAAWLP